MTVIKLGYDGSKQCNDKGAECLPEIPGGYLLFWHLVFGWKFDVTALQHMTHERHLACATDSA